MKVYEAIAQSLIAEGVTDFFGLMGDGNMWLWGAICRDPKVRGYSARHESMSVSMADGYARTTGKVGVASTTCGPGFTQIMTALTIAARGNVPLVVFAGDSPIAAAWYLQQIDMAPASSGEQGASGRPRVGRRQLFGARDADGDGLFDVHKRGL